MKNLLVAVLVVLFVLTIAAAEIPQVMGYQGRVTDNAGNPVADANYTMRFRIYDNAGGSGSPLWDSGNRTVSVGGGVFSVVLGESPQPALGLGFDQDYWLLVTFDGEDQTPLRQLGSVGYAYMASGLVPGTVVSGSVSGGYGGTIVTTNSSTAPDASGLYAYANGGAGYTHGVYASSNSPDGNGLFGRATAGAGPAHGVYAQALSTAGTGVFGEAAATIGTTYGVHGKSMSPGGRGVYGQAGGATGWCMGVLGETTSSGGDGVHGTASATSGYAYGGYFESASASGRGVFGWAAATTGTAHGVYGSSASESGTGVYGEALSAGTGTTYGGRFVSHSLQGSGVLGESSGGMGSGVQGENSGYGGAGVYGLASNAGYGAGVVARATGTTGVGVGAWATATSGATWGGQFRNSAPSGAGVYGWASATNGVTHGVWGETWSTTAGAFGVYYTGGIGGTGAMTSVTLTSQGPTGLGVHTTAGDWVEDFGRARLAGGRARVELDRLFLETVTIDETYPMMVFVELGGECNGVYVVKGTGGFDVVELRGGASSVPFDYRVLARRKGFEETRLEVCEAAKKDPYLYPEFKEQRMQQLQEERRELEEEQQRRAREQGLPVGKERPRATRGTALR